jgi:meiotic recombination protein REC8
VYSQQCGYTLLDVQAMHDKMRQTLRSVPAGGLDPSAGKARLVSLRASQLAGPIIDRNIRPEQLVLPYDPSFLPENNLPGLGLDLSKLNRLLETESSQQSNVSIPRTPDLSQSALSNSSVLGLNIPSDENILRDMGGFSSEADVASSAKGGLDFGRVLTSSLHDEGGVLLQPDFEFDENGNIVELGGRTQNEVRTRPVSEVREDGPNDLVVDQQVNPWLASKLDSADNHAAFACR